MKKTKVAIAVVLAAVAFMLKNAEAAAKPYLTATTKTLRVGESFLLIQGQYTDYESTFSYNDRIATIDHAGRVVATGIGTTKVLVNRGTDANGNYRDYICTIKVVAGTAAKCSHQWMDTRTYNANGVAKGIAFVCKTYREEGYEECKICGEKFLTSEDLLEHIKTYNHGSTSGSPDLKGENVVKFEKLHYCSKCDLQKN